MTAYVRWRIDVSRAGRVFPPLDSDHPDYNAECGNPACDARLGDGTPVQLLAIGPDSIGSLRKHMAGRWYSALAVVVHERCMKKVVP